MKELEDNGRRPMTFDEFWKTVGSNFSEDEEITREQMEDGSSCIIYRDQCGEIIGVYDCDENTGGFAWEN